MEEPIGVALAVSGGGYRSMLTAAGIIMAFDEHTPSSMNPGHLGGLFQSMNYIAGVSGGSWAVINNVLNDRNSLYDVVTNNGWQSLGQRLLPGIPDFDPGYHQQIDFNTSTNNKANPRIQEQKSLITTIFNLLKGRPRQEKTPIKILPNINPFSKANRGNLEAILEFYKTIHYEVREKKFAGFYVSFTDYWGRILSRRVLPQNTNNMRLLSSILDLESMKSHDQPFPLICALQRSSRSKGKSNESVIFEISPIEMGSWGSNLKGFIETKYIGTNFTNGYPEKIQSHNGNHTSCKCSVGYDNIGFLVATSSSLFNSVFMIIYNYLTKLKLETKLAIETILDNFGISDQLNVTSDFPKKHRDYAIFSPNPFFHYSAAQSTIKDSHHIYLVDGGDDGQNIPFESFINSPRNVDIILSYDMSSDLDNFPNATSLIKSGIRYHNPHLDLILPSFKINNNSHTFQKSRFPFIPGSDDVKKLQLLKQPVFLGCDLIQDYPDITTTTNNTSSQRYKELLLPPLIIYTANNFISYPSNTSTFKLSYEQKEMFQMIENGYNLATLGNSTYFAACMKCAILKRSFDRISLQNQNSSTLFSSSFEVPKICTNCYNQFCYKH